MKLKEFLIKAKIRTYAGSGEGGEKILKDGSKELIYEKNDFKYKDAYFGFDPFVGEEIVSENGKFMWGMNYYGGTTSNIVSAKEVYEFLKKSMKLVTEDRPFRGPDNFKEGDFEYIDKSKGDIENFKGVEVILYKGKEVYRLEYHGGYIKPKSQ